MFLRCMEGGGGLRLQSKGLCYLSPYMRVVTATWSISLDSTVRAVKCKRELVLFTILSPRDFTFSTAFPFLPQHATCQGGDYLKFYSGNCKIQTNLQTMIFF